VTVMPDALLACFREAAREGFERRVIDLLRRRFVDAEGVSDVNLRPVVQEQIARAESYRLICEGDVASYVATAWVMGRNFDRGFPAAARVLRNLALRPRDKRVWLERWTVRMLATLEQKE